MFHSPFKLLEGDYSIKYLWLTVIRPNNSGNSHIIMDELLLMDYELAIATKNI